MPALGALNIANELQLFFVFVLLDFVISHMKVVGHAG